MSSHGKPAISHSRSLVGYQSVGYYSRWDVTPLTCATKPRNGSSRGWTEVLAWSQSWVPFAPTSTICVHGVQVRIAIASRRQLLAGDNIPRSPKRTYCRKPLLFLQLRTIQPLQHTYFYNSSNHSLQFRVIVFLNGVVRLHSPRPGRDRPPELASRQQDQPPPRTR